MSRTVFSMALFTYMKTQKENSSAVVGANEVSSTTVAFRIQILQTTWTIR